MSRSRSFKFCSASLTTTFVKANKNVLLTTLENCSNTKQSNSLGSRTAVVKIQSDTFIRGHPPHNPIFPIFADNVIVWTTLLIGYTFICASSYAIQDYVRLLCVHAPDIHKSWQQVHWSIPGPTNFSVKISKIEVGMNSVWCSNKETGWYDMCASKGPSCGESEEAVGRTKEELLLERPIL